MGNTINKKEFDAKVRENIAKIQQGDSQAFNELVVAYQKEINIMATKYENYTNGPSVDKDDYLQLATLGLWQGVMHFDLSKPERPWTYLQKWCQKYCSEQLAKSRTAKVPQKENDMLVKAKNIWNESYNGDEAIERIQDELNVTSETARDLVNNLVVLEYQDQYYNDQDGNEKSLIDDQYNKIGGNDPRHNIENESVCEEIYEVLGDLAVDDPEGMEIFIRHRGLRGEPESFVDLGPKCGMSKDVCRRRFMKVQEKVEAALAELGYYR